MKKLFGLHPLMYAVLPTLVLYSHNIREAWPSLMVRPLLYSLAFALLSWLFFWAVLRSKQKASLFTSVWLIAFFSYGHAYLFAANHGLFGLIPLGPHALLMGIYGAILAGFYWWLCRYKTSTEFFTLFFNIASVTLLLMNLIPLVPFEIKRVLALQKLTASMADQHLRDAPYQNQDASSYPDIYYFIFDRYAQQTILTEYFDFDNAPFITSLEHDNFFVADQSFANYPTTFLSLSSSLNMSHLTFLKDVLGEGYSDQSVLYKVLLNDHEVAQFLKSKGYQYYQLGSGWEPTKHNTLATENYNLFLDLNEFEYFLYENTLLNAVMGKVSSADQVFTGVKLLEVKARNVLYKKEKIAQLTGVPGPKFIFAHFLLPHPPYLQAGDCHALSFEAVRKRSDEVGYIDQLQCANSIMTELSQVIQKNTERPVVIIFQSDEGPYLPVAYFDDVQYKDTPNKDAYKIHPRILNAVYMSDKHHPQQAADYQAVGLKRDETPVNTFRLVFNYYFGTKYEMQEDRSYIFTDPKRPYAFTEITEYASAPQ